MVPRRVFQFPASDETDRNLLYGTEREVACRRVWYSARNKSAQSVRST